MPIVPFKHKISRDGDFYEAWVDPKKIKEAREENYIIRDMVFIRDLTGWISFYPPPKEDVVPILPGKFFDQLRPGDEVMVEIDCLYNGSTQEPNIVHYTDSVYHAGKLWPVIVLRNKLHGLPRPGTELFEIRGSGEQCLSEKSTESHHKILNKFGNSPYSK